MKLTVMQRDLYNRYDEWSEGARKQVAVSCFKGCDGCCYQAILTTPPEALLLAEALIKSNRAISFLPQLREEALLYEKTTPNMTKEERKSWFDIKHPCTFLNEHLCSIYPDRPQACRTYMVISAPELCFIRDGEVGQVNNIELLQLQLLFSSAQFGPVIAPFPIMVLKALHTIQPKNEKFEKAMEGLVSPEEWFERLLNNGERG